MDRTELEKKVTKEVLRKRQDFRTSFGFGSSSEPQTYPPVAREEVAALRDFLTLGVVPSMHEHEIGVYGEPTKHLVQLARNKAKELLELLNEWLGENN